MRLSLKFIGIEVDLVVNAESKESFIDSIQEVLKKNNKIKFSYDSQIYILENGQLIEKKILNSIKEYSNIFVYDEMNLELDLSKFLKTADILYLAPYLYYMGISKKNKLIYCIRNNADLLYSQLSNLTKIGIFCFQPELESILRE